MKTYKNNKLKFLFFIPLFIGIIALMTTIVMFLWNAILPVIIGVKMISFWQALGILILSKLLFGGFRFGGRRNQFRPNNRMKERFMNFSDEEKQEFKQQWKQRCAR